MTMVAEPTIREGVDPDAVKVFFDVAFKRMNDQMDEIDKLDAKTTTLLGQASIVIAVSGLLLANAERLTREMFALGALAFISYVFVLLFACFAYRPRGSWDFQPHLPTLRELTTSKHRDGNSLRLSIAAACTVAVESNTPTIHSKARFIRAAFACFVIEGACLGVVVSWLLLKQAGLF